MFFFASLALAACTAQKPAAAQAVESYLQALVDKDDTRLVTLVCPDYEMDALIEFDSFGLVETSLEGVACQQMAIEGDQATVVCQGSIQATYGTELRSFDLSERTYTLARSGGDWLVCGYTK
ncbi:MAG: nuclear transport factor 2 family protein [Chloroflexota bacterium]